MKKIIVIALILSFVVPSVSLAQETQATVEYVEQVRQQLIDYILQQIAYLQQQIQLYIEQQSQLATGGLVGGLTDENIVTTPTRQIETQEAPVEVKDVTPPKFRRFEYDPTGEKNKSDDAILVYVETDEPVKITVSYKYNENDYVFTSTEYKTLHYIDSTQIQKIHDRISFDVSIEDESGNISEMKQNPTIW